MELLAYIDVFGTTWVLVQVYRAAHGGSNFNPSVGM